MARLPERYAHLEHREGVVPYSVLSIADCRRAIRRTLPTRHHARLFFDAVAAQLGDRAVVDRLDAPDELRIYLRDAEHDAVIGAPLVRLTRGAGTSSSMPLMRIVNENGVPPEDAPDGWKPGDPPWAPQTELTPEILPRGPEMCGGAITLAEGHGGFTVEYDERGVRAGGLETGGDSFTWLRRAATAPYHLDTRARPPSRTPLSMLARTGLDARGHAPDALAALLIGGELPERVRWRVKVPTPVPASIDALVHVAREGLRAALFRGEIPLGARWIAADGIEGRAVAHGSTVGDTLEAFARACFVKKPRPLGASDDDAPEPAPLPPPEPPSTKTSADGKTTTISTGTIQLLFAGRPPKFPWPRAVPANVPAVLLALPAPPEVPSALGDAGFTRVVRCLGEHGAVGHVFVRDDAHGFTAIGEHVVDAIDLASLDAQLDAAEADLDETLALAHQDGDERLTCRRVTFAVFDDERRRPVPATQVGGELSAEPRVPILDGDVAPWRVVRERRTG